MLQDLRVSASRVREEKKSYSGWTYGQRSMLMEGAGIEVQKIAIYMVDGQKFEIGVDDEVAQRGKILLDKLEGDGKACGSLPSRPQQELSASTVT